MRHLKIALLKSRFAWWARESGAATIEFIVLFPVLLTILVGSLELGFYMTRMAFLERSLEKNVRELRLGNLDPATHAQLAKQICEDAYMGADCPNDILIELTPVSTESWDLPTDSIACANRVEAVNPVVDFQLGQENEVMLIRACLIVDPFFSTTTAAMGLPQDDSGGFLMSVSSTFVNEP